MNGLVLLNKPSGITSFQVLGTLKKRLLTKKIGHAGTLDRFAQGLLITLTGKYTRLISLFMAMEKEYRAAVFFGKATTTLDPEGEVTATGFVPEFEALKKAVAAFQGTLLQRPPDFSAVHVAGTRAYRLALRGEPVNLVARSIRISLLEIEEFTPPLAIVRVVCSKGTYIRALVRDLAQSLGTCAYVAALTRTRIGDFSYEEAITPEQFDPQKNIIQPDDFIDRLRCVHRTLLVPGNEKYIARGMALSHNLFQKPLTEGLNAVFSDSGELFALVEQEGAKLSYKMVLNG
jgi:tRNA pseudouridine55 synthase